MKTAVTVVGVLAGWIYFSLISTQRFESFFPRGVSSIGVIRAPLGETLESTYPLSQQSTAAPGQSVSPLTFRVSDELGQGMADDVQRLQHGGSDAVRVDSAGNFRFPNFTVPIKATVMTDKPPQTIRFRLHRQKTNETYHLTGRLIPNSQQKPAANHSPSSFAYEAAWNITHWLGEWRITVVTDQRYSLGAGQHGAMQHDATYDAKPRPYLFKINKRQQIIELARYWADQGLASSGQLPLFNACDGFVSYIYSSLGLPSPSLSAPGMATTRDDGIGAIRYLFGYDNDNFALLAAHIAIVSGAQRMIDNNWGGQGGGPQERNDREGIGTFYGATSMTCSPTDPAIRGQSLLDTL